jgi:hypothetical protein
MHSFSLDLSSRLSVQTILDHPFICQGYMPMFKDISDPKPTVLQPRILYQSKAPEWPVVVSGQGGAGQDDRWARRQFSSLWAPMPSKYDLSGESSSAAVSNDSKVIFPFAQYFFYDVYLFFIDCSRVRLVVVTT